jgi:hypothetical protein
MRRRIYPLNLFIINLIVIGTIAAAQLPSIAKEEYRNFQDESDRSLSDWYQRRSSYHQQKAIEYRKQAQFEAEMNEYELEEGGDRDRDTEEQQDPNPIE